MNTTPEKIDYHRRHLHCGFGEALERGKAREQRGIQRVRNVSNYSRVLASFCTIERSPSRGVASHKPNMQGAFLVLPVRIELTTSPLPRGCSTTELRQH
jgi:hypothetical protein